MAGSVLLWPDAAVVIALLGLIITILQLHRSNVERMTRIETKLNILFDWWTAQNERRDRHDA